MAIGCVPAAAPAAPRCTGSWRRATAAPGRCTCRGRAARRWAEPRARPAGPGQWEHGVDTGTTVAVLSAAGVNSLTCRLLGAGAAAAAAGLDICSFISCNHRNQSQRSVTALRPRLRGFCRSRCIKNVNSSFKKSVSCLRLHNKVQKTSFILYQMKKVKSSTNTFKYSQQQQQQQH